MKKIQFVFIGGKNLGYKSLEFLINNRFMPTCVVPNKDDNGKDNVFCKSIIKLSKKNNIKVIKLTNLYKFIIKKKIDLIFCLGSTQILPKNILNIPKIGSLNIHPSLLPKYRGRTPHVWAIINGESTAGVTAHFINEGCDTGDIILQHKVPILDTL